MRTCVPLALIIPSLLVMPGLDDALCFTSLALCSALSLARQVVSPAFCAMDFVAPFTLPALCGFSCS
jgi:hypothetical protein